METFALVPHRDVILRLIRISKNFVADVNKKNGKTILAPNFPLWSFSDDFSKQISKVQIGFPRFQGNDFFYPLLFCADGRQSESRIVFAKKIVEEDFSFQTDDFLMPNDFPMDLRIFKTGKVLAENNGFKLFQEKWTKN